VQELLLALPERRVRFRAEARQPQQLELRGDRVGEVLQLEPVASHVGRGAMSTTHSTPMAGPCVS
jgi:hypothetical protein